MWKGMVQGKGGGEGRCGVVNFCYGLLLWPVVVPFYYALLLWPSTMAFCCTLLPRPSGMHFCDSPLEWPSTVAFWFALLRWPSGLHFCAGLLVESGLLLWPCVPLPPSHPLAHTWLPKWVVRILLKCIFCLLFIRFQHTLKLCSQVTPGRMQ